MVENYFAVLSQLENIHLYDLIKEPTNTDEKSSVVGQLDFNPRLKLFTATIHSSGFRFTHSNPALALQKAQEHTQKEFCYLFVLRGKFQPSYLEYEKAPLALGIKRLNNDAKMPTKGHPTDACWDLYSTDEVSIFAKEYGVVGTGISLDIPKGYRVDVRARSGAAYKHGIGLVNGVGTIDEGYQGEVKVILYNLGGSTYKIQKGDRIAQMHLERVLDIAVVPVIDLADSDRGEAGFGSTGK